MKNEKKASIMKAHLSEAGTYFKAKVLKGDYVVKKFEKLTISIVIDEEFEFNMWVGEMPEMNFNFYSPFQATFLDSFLMLETQAERKAAWMKLKPRVTEYNKVEGRRIKQAQIDSLQKELNELTDK